MDIWDLIDCLQTYKKIMKEEHNANIYINFLMEVKYRPLLGVWLV